MKVKRIAVIFAVLCLFLFSCAVPAAGAAAGGVDRVKVPLVLDITEPIAGAEFQIELTDALKMLEFEKSDGLMSASVTPVVEKGSTVYLGFYSAGNDFSPQEGALDIGYLVVDYQGGAGQSITITEVKTVQVIDKDTTESVIVNPNKVVKIPLEAGDAVHLGKPSVVLWVVLAAAAAAAGALVLVLFIRLKKRRPGA